MRSFQDKCISLSDDKLKPLFHPTDITSYISKHDESSASAADNFIHGRAKEMFYRSWCSMLPGMGGKASLKNFSRDYPVKLLEKTDESYVSDKVIEAVLRRA